MPLSTEDQAKLDDLLEMIAAGESPHVAEVIAVFWPTPTGTVYYAASQLDELYPDLGLEPVEARLSFNDGAPFREVIHESGLSDESVDLDFWDADGVISDLFQLHGAGVRVEIFYYFSDVDLLLSEWWGHLQPPDQADCERFVAQAAVGFRSSMLPLPRRAYFSGCQAIFGALLSTQSELDENDCPYNLHLEQGATSNPDYQNNLNGSAGSGGAFTKVSGGNSWNCGASHAAAVAEGDAVFSFTVSGAYACAGFSTTDSPRSGNTDFAFALQWNPDGSVTLKYSNTLLLANVATWTAGDQFRVEIRDGGFRMYKGSSELTPAGFAPPVPSYPLYLGIAIQNEGAGISAAQVAIGDIGAAPAFGLLDPDTGEPFTSCPRNSTAACIARLGDDLSYLAFDTIVETLINNQTVGPALLATSRGNESNLKRPLRVIIGSRVVRDLDLLAYTPQADTNHPDKGFVRCLFSVSEGRIRSMTNCKVNDTIIGFEHLNTRLGARRQPRTGFSPNVSNYSGTAHFFGVYGQVDASQYNATNLRGEATCEGLDDIRVYTTETSYTEQYTQSRAWALLRALMDKRWGMGYDRRRFEIETDLIPLAAWCAETVAFTGSDGTLYTGPRTTFNGELNDRNAQQQITDICLAGRIGIPFPHQGKLRILPLSKVTIDESIPVFVDDGAGGNICVDTQGKSTLTRSIVSDAELPNRIVVTFDDAAHGNVERPLTFEDVEQQLRAGRAFGDTSRRVVEKKYSALGVTSLGETGRLGNLLLDLGEFDEGGLQNNLRIQFDTWFAFVLALHKYKVIKVVSPQLTRYGFEYFRIRSVTRKSTLIASVSAQAYPVEYYSNMESIVTPPPIAPPGGEPNPGGVPGELPCNPGFTSLSFEGDHIALELPNC
jgi:hypothetical protein